MPPLEDLAATLRDHLWRAGVRRAELHQDRPTTKHVTFYDLRAMGITWEVLDGTEHLRIMQRAGHQNFSTTQGYIREAEAVGLNVETPCPPLPASLAQSSNQSSALDDSFNDPASLRQGGGRPQRDSKARSEERPATLRNDPQRERAGRGAGSVRNVAESGAVDESLDDSGGDGRLPAEALVGVVEAALAEALSLAALAKRWELVAQLAEELAARRQARGGAEGADPGAPRLATRRRAR